MAENSVAFDKAAALERLGDDEELLAELAEVYLDDQDSMMADLKSAIEASDAEALGKAAHKLKGAASNFCAEPTVEAAQRLEEMARAEQLAGMEETWSELQKAIAALTGALKELTPSP